MTAKEDAEDAQTAAILVQRLGGALTVDDVLILRAVCIWHRAQWDLRGEREDGVSGRQRAPVISPDEKRALKMVGLPPRPVREPGGNAYVLDQESVQPWLDRGEVATGYLMSRYQILATGQEASYPNADVQLPLGPMDVMTVWEQVNNRVPEGLELDRRGTALGVGRQQRRTGPNLGAACLRLEL